MSCCWINQALPASCCSGSCHVGRPTGMHACRCGDTCEQDAHAPRAACVWADLVADELGDQVAHAVETPTGAKSAVHLECWALLFLWDVAIKLGQPSLHAQQCMNLNTKTPMHSNGHAANQAMPHGDRVCCSRKTVTAERSRQCLSEHAAAINTKPRQMPRLPRAAARQGATGVASQPKGSSPSCRPLR